MEHIDLGMLLKFTNAVGVIAALGLFALPALAADSGGGVLVFDAKFFEAQRPNTAWDMIRRLPGFTFDAGASARGFAGTAGNVLVDGERPTSKTDALDSILQRIPASDVERIELVRGGAPGIDMQGQTVVANIIRKKVDSTKIVATAEDTIFTDGHMIPFGSLELTRHDGARLYEAAVSVVNNFDDSVGIGRHDVFDASGTLLEQDVARSHGLGIGYAFKGAGTTPLFGGQFKANLTLQDSPFISKLTYDSPILHQLFLDKSRTNSAELGLHWKGPLGGTELETLVLQRFAEASDVSIADDTVVLQDFRSRSTTGESIARATDRYLPMSSLTLEAGGEVAYNFLKGSTSFAVDGVPVPLPSAIAKVEELRGELFGQGTWKFADDWLFEAGARFEVSRISERSDTRLSRSFFYPKPRAVLTWAPDKDTQVRIRYERVLGQLDFNNFIATSDLSATGVTAGNANLRPDQRVQYELSFERHFWEKGAVVVSLLHEEIKDVVDFVPVVGPTSTFDAPGNIGNGRNNQVTVGLTIPLDRFGLTNGLLKATNIFRFSKVTDPVTGASRVISAQRPQEIQLRYTQDFTSINSTLVIAYFNGWTENSFRLTQTRQRRLLPPYLAASWEYKPTPDWSIHFEVDNILRFIYDDVRSNFAGPRDTFPLSNVDEFRTRSQPQFLLQIRRTFG